MTSDSTSTGSGTGGHPLPARSLPIAGDPLAVGRSDGASLRLFHPSVSRNHAVIERQGELVVVRDLESRYGTFVNGFRIGSKSLEKDDVIRFGTATSYRYNGIALVYVSEAAGYAISMRGVAIVKDDRVLVAGVTFDLPPNAFVGILGPSGAGKSTLLSVLASYHRPVVGEVFYDGDRPLRENIEEYRACLGNVPQEDVIYSGLTARENLTYSARLRSSEVMKDEEIAAQVESALAQVEMTDHADKLVDKLSGGQQKRVSVALELLKRPRLLLLDEPTSGLDPAAEANLIERLKVIASQGTTIVCTTHQMDNIGLFDVVVVVGVREGVGRIAYVGGPDGLLGHFGCRGYADAFDLLRVGSFTPLGEDNSPTSQMQRGDAGGLVRTPRLQGLLGRTVSEGVLRQASTVASRCARRILRDRTLVITMAVQPLALGGLLAVTQYEATNPRFLQLFVCIVAIWLGLNNSARDLVRERKNFVREQLAGLSPDAYLIAKGWVFALIGFFQTVILVAVTASAAAVTIGTDGTASDFAFGRSFVVVHMVILLLTLFLSYLCGLGLGLLASILAPTEEAAVAALPLLIMPQLLVSSVAVGCVNEGFNSSRAFKPLVSTLRDDNPVLGFFGRGVDDLSMVCYSRPASLVLDTGNAYWGGDLLHLVLLMVLTWTAVYVAFSLSEAKWPKLLRIA